MGERDPANLLQISESDKICILVNYANFLSLESGQFLSRGITGISTVESTDSFGCQLKGFIGVVIRVTRFVLLFLGYHFKYK